MKRMSIGEDEIVIRQSHRPEKVKYKVDSFLSQDNLFITTTLQYVYLICG